MIRETRHNQFVGRAVELARLRSATRGGRLIAIHGEAGVGKTRLVEELARQQSDRDFLWGRWQDEAAEQAYAGFIDVVRGAQQLIVDSGKDRKRTGTSEIDQRLLGALPSGELIVLLDAYARFLEALPGAPVIVLDDLHRADDASLALLENLVRRRIDSHLPPLIVLWRNEDAPPDGSMHHTIEALEGDGLVEDIALTGLDLEEIGTLVENLVDRKVGPDAKAILNLTRGNPLFAQEILLDALEDDSVDDLLQQSHKGWTLPNLPQTVAAAIRRRLERAEADVLEMLRTLSVLGREFEIALLRSSGLLSSRQLKAVPRALRQGFLVERRFGESLRLAFSHPLVGSVLYHSLDPIERTELHHQVAETLERLPADRFDAEIAHHLLEAQRWEDRERALKYLVRAANHARAALAYREARQLWRRAFRMLETGIQVEPGERLDWLREYADMCSSAGFPDEAMDLYRELARELEALGDDEAVADVYGAMGWTMHIHGRRAEIPQYLERAVPPGGFRPSHRSVSLLAAHAVGLLSAGRLYEGKPFLDQAFEMARKHPEIKAEGLVCHLGIVWHTWDPGGDPSLVPQLVVRAERAFKDEGNSWSYARVEAEAAMSFFVFGEIERCHRHLQGSLDVSARTGNRLVEADALAVRSLLRTLEGDWQSAESDAQRSESILSSAGTSIYIEVLRRARALRLFLRGNTSEARAEVAKLDSFLTASLEPHFRLAEGNREGALTLLNAIEANIPSDGHGGVWLLFALSLTAAFSELGQPERAMKWTNAIEKHRAWATDWWQPEHVMFERSIANRKWLQGLTLANDCIGLFASRGWKAMEAIVGWRYARGLVLRSRPSDRRRARELLDTSLPTLAQCGIVRAQSESRALLARLSRGRPGSRHLSALTARELLVLHLVEHGLTNRSIASRLGVSSRTIDSHVSNIISKLRVKNRTEAITVARAYRIIT